MRTAIVALCLLFLPMRAFAQPFVTDGASQAASHQFMDYLLNGNANDFGLTIQGGMNGASAGPAYEKAGLLIEMQTNDPSNGATHDMVGADIRGIIAGGVTNGRAWGINPQCVVNPANDGLCIGEEIDVRNYGADQPSTGIANSKYGMMVQPIGNPITADFYTFGGGATAHIVVGADTNAIAPGGYFLRLWNGVNAPFAVGADGGVTIGNPAGGDMGPGTINISGRLYVNGVPASPMRGQK